MISRLEAFVREVEYNWAAFCQRFSDSLLHTMKDCRNPLQTTFKALTGVPRKLQQTFTSAEHSATGGSQSDLGSKDRPAAN